MFPQLMQRDCDAIVFSPHHVSFLFFGVVLGGADDYPLFVFVINNLDLDRVYSVADRRMPFSCC